MDRPRRATRRWGLMLAVAVSLTVLPACGASAGGWPVRRPRPAAGPAASAPYTVYRPAFREPPINPVFINGYAGYNYGRGPRASYAPTGYLAEIEQPGARPLHRGWFGR